MNPTPTADDLSITHQFAIETMTPAQRQAMDDLVAANTRVIKHCPSTVARNLRRIHELRADELAAKARRADAGERTP